MSHPSKMVIRDKRPGVYIASYNAAEISLANLFDATTGNLQKLPLGYVRLGRYFAQGADFEFARSVETTDIDSWETDSPARADIISDPPTLRVEPCLTSQKTMRLLKGSTTYWRVLVVGIRCPGREIVYARFLPFARVTAFAGQATIDQGPRLGAKIVGHVDPALGTPEQFFFSGEGLSPRTVDMGYAEVDA